MYPYQYNTWQGMYPAYPMMYRGCSDCPMMYGLDNRVQEEETVSSDPINDFSEEEVRNQEPYNPQVGMQTPMKPGMGITAPFLSGMSMKPGMMAQTVGLKQDTFSIVLKQLQTEAPEILSALVGLGISVETLRQIILRIIDAAKKEQE